MTEVLLFALIVADERHSVFPESMNAGWGGSCTQISRITSSAGHAPDPVEVNLISCGPFVVKVCTKFSVRVKFSATNTPSTYQLKKSSLSAQPMEFVFARCPGKDWFTNVTSSPRHAIGGKLNLFSGLVTTRAGVESGEPIAPQNGLWTLTFTPNAL